MTCQDWCLGFALKVISHVSSASGGAGPTWSSDVSFYVVALWKCHGFAWSWDTSLSLLSTCGSVLNSRSTLNFTCWIYQNSEYNNQIFPFVYVTFTVYSDRDNYSRRYNLTLCEGVPLRSNSVLRAALWLCHSCTHILTRVGHL